MRGKVRECPDRIRVTLTSGVVSGGSVVVVAGGTVAFVVGGEVDDVVGVVVSTTVSTTGEVDDVASVDGSPDPEQPTRALAIAATAIA